MRRSHANLNLAERLSRLEMSHLESAAIIQRSPSVPDVIARLIEPDMDAHEAARIARGVLAGDRSAIRRMAGFNKDRINSLARVLCLGSDDEGVDRGIDLFRAQALVKGPRSLRRGHRFLLADGLILRHRFDEASKWIGQADFEGVDLERYALSVFNPFRPEVSEPMPGDEWLERYNRFISPSGDLGRVELTPSADLLPFDRLTSSISRTVEGPLITVVMSSYRPDESIFVSIRSILNQTWRSLELLVVDDASGAEFDDIYRRVEAMDSRIRLVRQKTNGGTYLNRNRALTLARGTFIGFQDDDDWSHPERLERQMRPLLQNPDIMATQSWCFRTDDYLDTVKLGYRKHLRRNESSLLFRVEAVRRIGFFHFTRKGGDSEYRMRLEAEYGQETELVGDDPLAIIRLTPGSLSRNEFAAGFRHPSRLVYTESYKLSHSRAKAEGSLYRSVREYRDTFVPAKFQPRRDVDDAAPVDVVVVADLRVCVPGDDWVRHLCESLHGAGLRVGLAHYVGFGFDKFKVDRIAPDISGLFLDGIAQPIDFGERRAVHAVIVSDGALLAHLPWRPEKWSVERVFAVRESRSTSTGTYDDATASFTSLLLFGQRPTWFTAQSAPALVPTVARHTGTGHPRTTHTEVVTSDASASTSSSQAWGVAPEGSIGSVFSPNGEAADMVTIADGVPYSAARSQGRWCVVVGWPSFGYESADPSRDASAILLNAWQNSPSHFEKTYADLGGSCMVLRGDGQTVSVRTTGAAFFVRLVGSGLYFWPRRFGTGSTVVQAGNQADVAFSRDGGVVSRPISTPVDYDGALLDELSHMVRWTLKGGGGRRLQILLTDDYESALVAGLLRESVDHVDLFVQSATSRVADFLRSRFVQFSTVPPRDPVSDESKETVAPTVPSPFEGLRDCVTSYRFRRLLAVVVRRPATDDELDALWHGISGIRYGKRRPPSSAASGEIASIASTVPALKQQLPWERARGAAKKKSLHLVAVEPDISFGEDKPLRALIRRAASDRLLVVLTSRRLTKTSGYDFELGSIDGVGHHIVALEDTTLFGGQSHRYGWFYGSERDTLLVRYAQLVRQMARQMECTEIVVKGDGMTAIPALLLASYLGDVTVLIERPELVAGESDMEQFRDFVRSQVKDADVERFSDARSDRLQMREILNGSPEGLKIVLVGADDDWSHHGRRALASDPRTEVYSGTARAWLASAAQGSADSQ